MSSANTLVSPVESSTIDEKTHQRLRRRSIIREFCLNTTAHGLPGIARSQSLHNRIFWSIALILFTGILIYFIVQSILAYFQYPTSMDIKIAQEWPQYFPAVTLCNASPFRLDKFLPVFSSYLNQTNMTTVTSNDVNYIKNFILEEINQNRSMESFFYPLSSMLYSCLFNDRKCTKDDFISFVSPYYGKCYTFNAKLKNGTARYIDHDGGNGVLELAFYVHSHQYVPNLRPGIGISVLVHDNTQIPLIESTGLHLSPGKAHRLTYRKRRISLLPAPYSLCGSIIPRYMKPILENYPEADYGYTGSVCSQLCGQTYAYEKCGCVNPRLWNARLIAPKGTNNVVIAPLCQYNNTCFAEAMNVLFISPRLFPEYCSECSSQCLITQYPVQTSFLTAAFEWQMEKIKKFVEQSLIPLPLNWSNTWSNDIKENYLSVSVIREALIIENNTQSATISEVDVLSNIGGQTGLWIGISFLSIMELIELLYRLARVEFYRIIRRNQQ